MDRYSNDTNTVDKGISFINLKLLNKHDLNLFLSKGTSSYIDSWISFLKQNLDNGKVKKYIFSIYGEDQFSLHKTAHYIAHHLSREIILIEAISGKTAISSLDCSHLPLSEEKKYSYALEMLNYGNLKKGISPKQFRESIEVFASDNPILFIFTKKKFPVILDPKDYHFIDIGLKIPIPSIRKEVWKYYLSGDQSLLDVEAVNRFVQSFNMHEGQIRDAVYLARNNCLPFQDKKKDIFETELLKACEKISRHSLSDFAVEIESKGHG